MTGASPQFTRPLRMKRKLAWVAAGLALLSFASCSSLGYYWQAMRGQFEISTKQRPIADWLENGSLTAQTRAQLQRVAEMRSFASRELGLPDNPSYRSYADLGRSYVLWNVFAAPEFSNELLQSCFPVAGCVTYRGFFAEEKARDYAAAMRRQGHDTYVGGVPAYSTLGWFDDPVLNTFIQYPEAELARLIFHELAHQIVYVKDDSMFNESFATAVEEEGIKRWVAARSADAAAAPANATELAQQWQRGNQRRAQFRSMVARYREQLAALYAETISDASKRQRKARVFAALKSEYQQLVQSWGESASRSAWLKDELNNAHLASVATYTELVPAFHAMLAQRGGDLRAFYAEVKTVAGADKTQRLAQLEGLLPSAAQAPVQK